MTINIFQQLYFKSLYFMNENGFLVLFVIYVLHKNLRFFNESIQFIYLKAGDEKGKSNSESSSVLMSLP